MSFTWVKSLEYRMLCIVWNYQCKYFIPKMILCIMYILFFLSYFIRNKVPN